VFEWFGKVNFVPHTKVDEFATHLKDGRLMGSKCKSCGQESFPPRADCPKCLGGEFEYKEWSGQGTVMTFTKIVAAPTGFQDIAPYTVGVVELKDGGRLVAWFGDTIPEAKIKIGMEVQVVPRMFEELPKIKLFYSLEQPGTTWGKAPLTAKDWSPQQGKPND
jgi:uncharacterized protein